MFQRVVCWFHFSDTYQKVTLGNSAVHDGFKTTRIICCFVSILKEENYAIPMARKDVFVQKDKVMGENLQDFTRWHGQETEK